MLKRNVGKNAPDGQGMILDPKSATTCAQIASMMMRFCIEIRESLDQSRPHINQ